MYVKNIPSEWSKEKVHGIFSEYGNIKSLVLMSNPIGQFGFVCFEDPNGNYEYGPKCAQKAIESLNLKEIEGKKLIVRPALKKYERDIEKKKQILNFKNSKKRFNLYVKNFPPHWEHEQIHQLFGQFGEIESIKLEKKQTGACFAFVCFKSPESAMNARQSLNHQDYEGHILMVNHYEIKELRQVQIEERLDKADFENY